MRLTAIDNQTINTIQIIFSLFLVCYLTTRLIDQAKLKIFSSLFSIFRRKKTSTMKLFDKVATGRCVTKANCN